MVHNEVHTLGAVILDIATVDVQIGFTLGSAAVSVAFIAVRNDSIGKWLTACDILSWKNLSYDVSLLVSSTERVSRLDSSYSVVMTRSDHKFLIYVVRWIAHENGRDDWICSLVLTCQKEEE